MRPALRACLSVGTVATVGCSSGDDASSPAHYYVEDTAVATPAVSPESAAEAIDTTLGTVLRYNGQAVFDAYDEVMTYADTCPDVSAQSTGGSLWDEVCTAQSGARFAGFVSEYRADSDTLVVRSMHGEATISTPEGVEFVIGGDVSTQVDSGAPAWTTEVAGVARYDGPAAGGSWMEDGVDLDLAWSVGAQEDGAVRTATLEGNVGDLSGDVTAVSFEGVVVSRDAAWPCPEEPSGEIAVRDADGVWADVLFDVEGSAEEGWTIADGACDGCGTMWSGAVDMGQVCVDTTVLLDASLPPW